jgi:uncharacterized protein YjbI with pentapeptide repeats
MLEEGLLNNRPIDVSPSPFCHRSQTSALCAEVKPKRLYFLFIAITSPVQDKVLRRSVEITTPSGHSDLTGNYANHLRCSLAFLTGRGVSWREATALRIAMRRNTIHSVRKPTVILLIFTTLCCNFTAIAFDEADLKKLEVLNVCAGCDLSGADLSRADLTRADLSGANLKGADLRYADLSRANLKGADLRGVDLRRAVLRYADLTGANLSGANLSGANLRWADLSGAELKGVDLKDAKMGDAIICETLTAWGEDNSGCK